MSQNLRVATFVPIADPAAIGNLIKTTAGPTANRRLASAFAADDAGSGGGGGGTPSNAPPAMDGAASPGIGTDYSRGDHVHPSDTSKAAVSHSHVAANVTDFSEAVDDRVGALLVAGTNIALNYNDAGNALTINGTAGGGTPGGSTTQVQFNDAGAFAGDAGMVFDKATDTLTVAGQIKSAKGFSPSAPNIVVSGTDGFTSSGGNIFVASGGVSKWLFDGTNGTVSAGPTGSFGWTPGAVDAVAPDTAISRNAAGVVEVNNGTLGTLADLKVKYLAPAAIQTMQAGTNLDYSCTGVSLGINGKVEWRSDVAIARNAAGVLEINDSAVTPALRDLKARAVEAGKLVAAYPANPGYNITIDVSAAVTSIIANGGGTPRGGVHLSSGSGSDTIITAGSSVSAAAGIVVLNGAKVQFGQNVLSPDVFLQPAVDVLEINNGTAGQTRDLKARKITVAADPTAALELSTKQYVDAKDAALPGKKNYIINGAMMISQENGGTASSAAEYYPVDMFYFTYANAGTVSIAQVASPTPGGSPNRIRCTVTAADATVAAGDFATIIHGIEGFNSADLKGGTAGAKQITVQFGVKAPAGTYTVVVLNGAKNRSYPATYVISAGEANTDVVKSVTLTLDTTAPAWAVDNAAGMRLYFSMMCGTTYQGTANTWQAGEKIGATTQFNFMGTNGNVFELFDVSLTEGVVAPPFVPPHYATELEKCQRYFESVGMGLAGVCVTAGNIVFATTWNVTKRANPTIILAMTNPGAFASVGYVSASGSTISMSSGPDPHGGLCSVGGFTGLAQNGWGYSNQGDMFKINARL